MKRPIDTALSIGAIALIGYGALSFLASCVPPPEQLGPDAGAGASEGTIPPLEPHHPATHYLCSCEDQSCIDEWLCGEVNDPVPICVSVQCGEEIFHYCSECG